MLLGSVLMMTVDMRDRRKVREREVEAAIGLKKEGLSEGEEG